MLQGGIQFFIEVLWILLVRCFKDSGNDGLSLGTQVKLGHIIMTTTSVVITN